MTVSEILNNIEVQGEYAIVYYDSQKQQRFKLEKCVFSESLEVQYMYVENGVLFFEIHEWLLFSSYQVKNRGDIAFLNPQKI